MSSFQGGAGITGGALSIASGATPTTRIRPAAPTRSAWRCRIQFRDFAQADPPAASGTLALSGGTVVTGGTIEEAGTSGILEITGGATLNDVGGIGAISITVDPLVKLVVENGTSISGTSAIANGGTIEDSGGLFTVGSNGRAQRQRKRRDRRRRHTKPISWVASIKLFRSPATVSWSSVILIVVR